MTTPRFCFALNPTEPLHMANLRTALFSWGLARAMQGEFILRVDDIGQTDQVATAVPQMIDALEWLGLEWDEGPDVGGPYEPYYQSQRQPFYEQTIERLQQLGVVYEAEEAGQQTSNTAAQGLFLRLPSSGTMTITDALRGRIEFSHNQSKDPLLRHGDGSAAPCLTTVCDDHLMRITHVVRSEAWLNRTALHSYLYHLLGWPEPQWIHLPAVVNQAGQMIDMQNKPHGYLLEDLQTAGYLPAAVFNYVILLGWLPDESGREIIRPTAWRRHLQLERLSTTPSKFDWHKLSWLNRHYLAQLSDADLLDRIRPYLEEYYSPLPSSEAWLRQLTHLIRPQLDKLEDAPEAAVWAFDDAFEISAEAAAALTSPAAAAVLTRLIAELAHIVLLDSETAASILKGLQRDFQSEYNWSAEEILPPIRAALTGTIEGPSLPEIMSLLGKARCLSRVGAAFKHHNS